MKVAIVHDWLTGMRGGEKVLEAFLDLFPEAHVHTLVHQRGSTSARIDGAVRGESWLGALPGGRRYYRALLPFYPAAIRSLQLDGYDLVLSLSHAAAKNWAIGRSSRPLHVSYCFTPMRYIWDQAQSYLGAFARPARPYIESLRRWDKRGARDVDHFVAISRFVAARIRCFYGRRASVIHPPVGVRRLTQEALADRRVLNQGEAFLCAGALVPYKRIEVAIRACELLSQPLWIAGSGPEMERLKRIAGKNVCFLGRLSDAELADTYRHCRALLFPGIEDFGIMPIECLASGRPVIAVHAGALRETLPGVKCWGRPAAKSARFPGVFARHPQPGREVEQFAEAISFFIDREEQFAADECIRAAEPYSSERFTAAWRQLLAELKVLPTAGAVPSEHAAVLPAGS